MEKKKVDDFVWEEYTDRYYLNEMDEVMAEGYDFVLKDSYVKYGKIIFKENIHFNSVHLCNDVLNLGVKSVYECGCSCGYQIYNIKVLFPEIEVAGCDLLLSQKEKCAKKLNIPEYITKNIMIMDFSKENAYKKIGKQYEYVFTNAVIMHLTYDKAVRFVQNMSKISSKYITISENGSAHDYDSLFEDTGILNKFKRETPFFFIKKNLV